MSCRGSLPPDSLVVGEGQYLPGLTKPSRRAFTDQIAALVGLTEGMHMQTHTLIESPIGDLTLVNTEGVLSGDAVLGQVPTNSDPRNVHPL